MSLEFFFESLFTLGRGTIDVSDNFVERGDGVLKNEVDPFTLGGITLLVDKEEDGSFEDVVLEVTTVSSSEEVGYEVSTGLGDGGVAGDGGKFSALLSNLAILTNALYVSSPASRDGQIVEGGCFNNVTKSVVLCFK